MTLSEFVEALGGTVETSNLYEVSPPAVSQWLADGFIPEQRYRQTKNLCRRKKLRFHESWFNPEPPTGRRSRARPNERDAHGTPKGI